MSWRASGLKAWAWQRLTAVYMALFLVAALILARVADPAGYEQWRALVGHPAVLVPLAVFFAFLLLHAWVGMRDVLLDYLHAPAARFTALALLAVGLVGMGLWLIPILARAYR
jgi:succinate dehydrogenase / fumarate reductase membrane anchor subunit